MVRKTFLPLLALMVLLFIFSSSVFAVGVRPLVISFDLRPGDVEEFELILTPGGTQETVALNLYHPSQQITGGLSYEEADPERHPATGWVNLDDQAVVPPDEETRVPGEIRVPYDAAGSHTVVVMAEPLVDEAETGITFRVRYAVRININVDRPGLRADAEVHDFRLELDEERHLPVLSTHLKNPSPLAYRAAGEVTIRDEGRRLVERVILRSQSAARAGRNEQRVYPGSEILFSGDVTEPLHPGTYDLQLFMYYADGRQIIRRETIEIGDEYLDPDRMEYIEVEPERIQETLRPGGAATQAVSVRNRTGDPLIVRIGGREIEPDYSHSIFQEFELQLRGEQEFELAARRSDRTVLILRPPRDIDDGGYYGTLEVAVFSPEGEHLETREVDMDVLIGEEHDHAAEFLDLELQSFDNEHIVSATVRNTSRVHIAPTARIYLRDGEGEIQRTLRLALQEDVERVLPGRTTHLVTTTDAIEPGDYTADISLEYAGEELAAAEVPLTIEEEGEE